MGSVHSVVVINWFSSYFLKLKIIINLNFGLSASRLDNRFFSLNSKLFNGLATHTPLMVKERCSMILKASTDVNGTDSDTPEASSDSEDENLPLESKLQLKLEHKMKMKLAKKIRLRRKKLVRKRGLRKMGRWPPSKMKKNKNV